MSPICRTIGSILVSSLLHGVLLSGLLTPSACTRVQLRLEAVCAGNLKVH